MLRPGAWICRSGKEYISHFQSTWICGQNNLTSSKEDGQVNPSCDKVHLNLNAVLPRRLLIGRRMDIMPRSRSRHDPYGKAIQLAAAQRAEHGAQTDSSAVPCRSHRNPSQSTAEPMIVEYASQGVVCLATAMYSVRGMHEGQISAYDSSAGWFHYSIVFAGSLRNESSVG
jgi:hypothetical protein